MGLSVGTGYDLYRHKTVSGTTRILGDEVSVPFTLGAWRMSIDGSNDVLIQNYFSGSWVTVETAIHANATGAWKWNIDGSNNLALQNDDSGYTDITTYLSDSGTLWRFAVVSDNLELQELIAGTWTANTVWTKLS